LNVRIDDTLVSLREGRIRAQPDAMPRRRDGKRAMAKGHITISRFTPRTDGEELPKSPDIENRLGCYLGKLVH